MCTRGFGAMASHGAQGLSSVLFCGTVCHGHPPCPPDTFTSLLQQARGISVGGRTVSHVASLLRQADSVVFKLPVS